MSVDRLSQTRHCQLPRAVRAQALGPASGGGASQQPQRHFGQAGLYVQGSGAGIRAHRNCQNLLSSLLGLWRAMSVSGIHDMSMSLRGPFQKNGFIDQLWGPAWFQPLAPVFLKKGQKHTLGHMSWTGKQTPQASPGHGGGECLSWGYLTSEIPPPFSTPHTVSLQEPQRGLRVQSPAPLMLT